MMLDVMVGDFPQDLDLTITIKSPTTHSIMIHCSKMDSMSSPRFYTSLVELIVSAICMADFHHSMLEYFNMVQCSVEAELICLISRT